jgi:hypothetical protein
MPSKMVANRRKKVVDTLLELLTSPDSPVTTAEVEHFVMTGVYFKVTDEIDKILQGFSGTPDLEIELAVGIVVHVLNRLLRSAKDTAEARRVPEENHSPICNGMFRADLNPEDCAGI